MLKNDSRGLYGDIFNVLSDILKDTCWKHVPFINEDKKADKIVTILKQNNKTPQTKIWIEPSVILLYCCK